MRFSLCLAVLASVLPASAEANSPFRHCLHVQRLPPIAGTIRVAPGAFGHGHRVMVVSGYGPRWPAPEPEIVTGGIWPVARPPVYAEPAYAEPAYRPRLSPGMQFAETRRWASGGTGLAGMIGNTGNPFAGVATWGTADSATTGAGWFDRDGERPLVRAYGEPAVYPSSTQYPAYGSGPQLGFYSSGAPYGMAYYSSGSSAGPYGSPGGLATYRSGSYGYGPRVIMIPGRRHLGQRGLGGPRIVRLGRRHHAYD